MVSYKIQIRNTNLTFLVNCIFSQCKRRLENNWRSMLSTNLCESKANVKIWSQKMGYDNVLSSLPSPNQWYIFKMIISVELCAINDVTVSFYVLASTLWFSSTISTFVEIDTGLSHENCEYWLSTKAEVF